MHEYGNGMQKLSKLQYKLAKDDRIHDEDLSVPQPDKTKLSLSLSAAKEL